MSKSFDQSGPRALPLVSLVPPAVVLLVPPAVVLLSISHSKIKVNITLFHRKGWMVCQYAHVQMVLMGKVMPNTKDRQYTAYNNALFFLIMQWI